MSDPSAAGERGAGGSACGSGRRSASILGLSFVSSLNLLSLAFLAYHFAGHPDETASGTMNPPPPGDPSMMAASPEREAAWTAEGIGGNVDLAPASRLVLDIASGIAGPQRKGPRESGERPTTLTMSAVDVPSPPAGGGPERGHWVQVGALSKERAAQHYWSGMQRRHTTLLGGREPRFFGPLEVGGSLYHIRLGPMTTEDASELCDQLMTEGVECFCLDSDVNHS